VNDRGGGASTRGRLLSVALLGEEKSQRALIQKINDKVELSRPAPQTDLNNR
jgi:hypothetical protein